MSSVVEISYVMVYGDEVTDLLVPFSHAGIQPLLSQRKLHVTDHPDLGVFLGNVSRLKVFSSEAALSEIARGISAIAWTGANKNFHPSFAHIIFEVTVAMKFAGADIGADSRRASLQIVDLGCDDFARVSPDQCYPNSREVSQPSSLQMDRSCVFAGRESVDSDLSRPVALLYRAMLGSSAGTTFTGSHGVLSQLLRESVDGSRCCHILAHVSPMSCCMPSSQRTLLVANAMRCRNVGHSSSNARSPYNDILASAKAEAAACRWKLEQETDPKSGSVGVRGVDNNNNIRSSVTRLLADCQAVEQYVNHIESIREDLEAVDNLQDDICTGSLGLASSASVDEPFLTNVCPSPLLSGTVQIPLPPCPGMSLTFGRPDSQLPHAIYLTGLGISLDHCRITAVTNEGRPSSELLLFVVEPFLDVRYVFVNGCRLTEAVPIGHGDTLVSLYNNNEQGTNPTGPSFHSFTLLFQVHCSSRVRFGSVVYCVV